MSYERSIDLSVTDFTDRFYGELIAKQAGGLENTLISPLSLFVAMMITWYSTAGQTKKEIGQTLSLSGDTDGYRLLQTVGTRLNNFSSNPKVTLSSYNRLFLFGNTDRNRRLSNELHQLLHAGVTKVDEDGATAAAATTVQLVDLFGSRPRFLLVDHPFLVMIVYNKSLPAFIGHFIEPGTD
ncbi:hypothetical protein PHET_05984 [Paragonimus heterotremus]|uniref:Serpin domain-containing protein n=1 Tax=Paragonimus heterotremus TaxID=100268 RepID=A0A8J4T770_9TREM|nr:hypothetical protein PHET_05984 [Paragonimus heterotremus]